jgi:putative peptide zinc metalloprotease protein
MPLPTLREELSIHQAPKLADGQPSWSIQDPARNCFFRIDWQTYEILVRWSIGEVEKIAASINAETTLQVDSKDVEIVIEFLLENELLTPVGDNVSQLMSERVQAKKSSKLVWLLKHYLFFRVPLVKPDKFLASTQAWVEPLYSRTFLRLTLIVFCIALLLVYRDYERFSQAWVDMFNLQGEAFPFIIIINPSLNEQRCLNENKYLKGYGCKIIL